MKIVFVNGPPRSGKDTFGSIAVHQAQRSLVVKFATHVKKGAHAAHGLHSFEADAFEQVKDQPSALFFGKTPREVYIAFSESYMKPLHGHDVFGSLLVRDILGMKDMPGTIFITDSGFVEEAVPVVRAFGHTNCALVRMHREGCTFAGDSRSYIEVIGVKTFDINNNGTMGDLAREVSTVLRAL